MLTMNTLEHKRRIVGEACRLLQPGGRYGIHELCVIPDTMKLKERQKIDSDLSSAIHVGARSLQTSEWRDLMETSGIHVAKIGYAPMRLLRPKQVTDDEGLFGTIRITKSIMINPAAKSAFWRCALYSNAIINTSVRSISSPKK